MVVLAPWQMVLSVAEAIISGVAMSCVIVICSDAEQPLPAVAVTV